MKAARGGKWSPDMSIVAMWATPWLFEMALAIPLPGVFFNLYWFILNLCGGVLAPWGNICSTGVRSPGQCDLMEGRKTMSDLHLAEVIRER